MATYNLTANTQYSNDSDTQNVNSVDTVIVAITVAYGLNITSTSNCSASKVGGGGNPSTVTLTVTFSGAGSYSVVLTQPFGGRTYTLSGTVTVPATIVPPTISGTYFQTTSTQNQNVAVTLSSQGSGGTLKYAQTTSNSVPASGWQTSATFAHPRGSTRYYWASRDEDTSGAYDGGEQLTLPFLTPGTTVYINNETIAFNATSETVTAGSTSAGIEYAIRLNSGGGALTGTQLTATGSTTNFTIQNSDLPSQGNTTTYRAWMRRPVSKGGDGTTWYQSTSYGQFTITREVESDTTPTPAFSFTDPTGVAPNSTQNVKVQILGINTTATVSRNSGTAVFQVSSSSVTPSSFSSTNKNITSGQFVHVQDTASSSFSTTKSSVIQVGTQSDTFSITTAAADVIPNQFVIPDLSDQSKNTVVYGISTAISGINSSITVSRTAGTGTFAVSSSTSVPSASSFNSSNKTITNGQYIHVKDTTASTDFTCKRTIISAGGKSEAFSCTTAAGFTADRIVSMGLYYILLGNNTGQTATRNVANGDTFKLTHNSNAGSSVHVASLDNVHASFTLTNCTVDTTSNVAQTDQATSGVNGVKVTVSGSSGATYSCVAAYTFNGVTHTYTLTGVIDPPAFGLEVFDASGNVRLSFDKRQARLHGRITGTGTGSSFNQSYTGYGVGGLGQWFAVNTTNSSNYFANTTSGTNNIYMQRADVRTQNFSYQIFSGSEDYDVLVFRF